MVKGFGVLPVLNILFLYVVGNKVQIETNTMNVISCAIVDEHLKLVLIEIGDPYGLY